jgi:hypothetical protein
MTNKYITPSINTRNSPRDTLYTSETIIENIIKPTKSKRLDLFTYSEYLSSHTDMIAKKEVAMSAKFNIGKASGTDSFKSNPLPKKKWRR